MAENSQSAGSEETSELELGIRPYSMRKPVTVRSTRTPNSMFSGDPKPNNPTATPIATSTRTRTETGRDKPLNRVQTAPMRSTAHSTAAEKTLPRRQQTADFPLSISQSQSGSQTFLTPDTASQSQAQNQRESIASSFPSSYHSAEESFNTSIVDEEVPPLPNPHPLSTSTMESKQALPTAQTPPTSASEQTVIPTQESDLTYRISARTTTSTGTRTTGRSASTSASVMEPSRQSTSDSGVYPRGNGIGGHGQASKNKVAEEEDLADLVAGWEQLVEEPEFDDEERNWDAKGKMKMPEPQYFGTRLSTTREEDEDFYGDYQDYEGGRMPEPSTHSRDQSSSTQQTLYPEISQPSSFPTGTTVRKVSPLIIPPTPKSPPPVPLSIRGEKQAQIRNAVDPATLGKSSNPTDPNPEEDTTQAMTPNLLRAGPSNPNTGVVGGTSPLRVHRKRPASATTAGGEVTSPATTSTEKENGSQRHYGTAAITGTASSRIERPDRPGSSGGGGLAAARTSLGTGSTNLSGTASGRVKTDSTSHRPSTDAHTYGHGRTTSTASASGVTRPSERRTSGGSARLPALPAEAKEKPSTTASAFVAAATIPTGSRLPPGVSSQMDTQYVNMLLALDDIPAIHNFAAAFFNWIYLAGFVLFPGTFTSLRNLTADQGSGVPAQVINTVTRLPLFIVAWVCVGIGATGMLWLLWRWKKNYVWGLNKIWVPGLLNSLAGLLSTLASIYGAQHGQFSSTSKVTLILTGLSTVVFALLTGFYMFWLVRRVKQRHDREIGVQRAGKRGEGMVDASTRFR